MSTDYSILASTKQNLRDSITISDMITAQTLGSIAAIKNLFSEKPSFAMTPSVTKLLSEAKQELQVIETDHIATQYKTLVAAKSLLARITEAEKGELTPEARADFSSESSTVLDEAAVASRVLKNAALQVGKKGEELVKTVCLQEGTALEGRCSYRQCTATTAKLDQCSRCKIAKYCSHDHQKAHWRFHRAVCKAPEESKPK